MKTIFVCNHDECKGIMGRTMSASEAVLCSICNDRKEMHVWCCDEHRKKQHSGMGKSLSLFTKEGLKEHYKKSLEDWQNKSTRIEIVTNSRT